MADKIAAKALKDGRNHSFHSVSDFDDIDNSDAKTCTVRERDRGLTIGKTENKIGSFRIVVYNEITEKLDYIYLTNKGRQLHTEREFLKRRPDEQRIRATYNHHFDHTTQKNHSNHFFYYNSGIQKHIFVSSLI